MILNPDHAKWMNEHNACGKGRVTSAFYGMQWGNSKFYISERCGCGSRFRLRSADGKPIIDKKETA